ncbi:MAG: hypothetical protein C4549_06645 [Deltaproteobacteria bacterium]|jgi:hypothetical protein|nr:MAG: hypothetical protein C4549_06645 [Deltaproteobacteria bacterium]
MVRLNLYNRDLFCGAQAIRREMEEFGVMSLPSLRTINRILSRNELTHRRTGRYGGDLGDDLKFVNNIIKQCGYLII